jgi:translocator assembly and maintenance protein 41
MSTPKVDNAVRKNLSSALSISLLLLPRSFSEEDLYVKIAGLSYSGDPRMSVPGAENPEKVKNIVRGPGSLLGFRHLYEEVLEEAKVERQNEKQGEDAWMVVSCFNAMARTDE